MGGCVADGMCGMTRARARARGWGHAVIDETDAAGGASHDARSTGHVPQARKNVASSGRPRVVADYALLVRALRGFVPSIAAVGLTRAWLSFQTGVCLSYDTPLASRGDLVLVQHAALVALSILATVVGLAAARGSGTRRRPPSSLAGGRRRGVTVILAGIVGSLGYVVGLLLAPASSLVGAACVVLMIAAFMAMLWVWCEDNVTPDFLACAVRLGLSFLVQYAVYALVLVLSPAAQRVAVALVPLVVMLALLRPPASAPAVPGGHAAPQPVPQVTRSALRTLVLVVTACCTAHGFLFRFSGEATGVWILGPLAVGLATCVLTIRHGNGEPPRVSPLRGFLLMTVCCQALGVVIMLLFSYDGEWTSLSKSLSYAASMTMAMTLGPFLASARERGRGAHAFGWLALYFLAFYASHYAVRILNPDMTVPLAAILLCLLGSVIAILLGDWSGLEVRPSTAGEPPMSGRRPPCADPEGLRAFGLTQREMDVLGGLLDGRTFKQIARENEVSVNTVRAQAQSLYRKLGVHSREELGERFGGADGGRDDEPA